MKSAPCRGGICVPSNRHGTNVHRLSQVGDAGEDTPIHADSPSSDGPTSAHGCLPTTSCLLRNSYVFASVPVVFLKFHGQLADRFLELAKTFHLVVNAAVDEKLRSVVQQLVAPSVDHPLRDAVFVAQFADPAIASQPLQDDCKLLLPVHFFFFVLIGRLLSQTLLIKHVS